MYTYLYTRVLYICWISYTYKCGATYREDLERSLSRAPVRTGAVYMLDCIYVYTFVHTGVVYTLDFIHSFREHAVKSTGAIYTIDFIRVYIFVHTSAVYSRDLIHFCVFVHISAVCFFKFRTCMYVWQPTKKIAGECSQERGHSIHIRFHIYVLYLHFGILAQEGRGKTIFKHDRYMHSLFYSQIHTGKHTLTFSKDSQCKYARTHTHTNLLIQTHTHTRARARTHTHTHIYTCIYICVYIHKHYIRTNMHMDTHIRKQDAVHSTFAE